MESYGTKQRAIKSRERPEKMLIKANHKEEKMKKRILVIPLVLLLAVSLVAVGCPTPAEIVVQPVEQTITLTHTLTHLSTHGIITNGCNNYELQCDLLFFYLLLQSFANAYNCDREVIIMSKE
ncbi:hypothetical protein M1N21_03780 [Dehalococcoidia bacterium]|nr:hypothetical protein [Dehalococcoidia bacterium]